MGDERDIGVLGSVHGVHFTTLPLLHALSISGTVKLLPNGKRLSFRPIDAEKGVNRRGTRVI